MRFEVSKAITLKTSVFWDDNVSSDQVCTQQDIIWVSQQCCWRPGPFVSLHK